MTLLSSGRGDLNHPIAVGIWIKFQLIWSYPTTWMD